MRRRPAQLLLPWTEVKDAWGYIYYWKKSTKKLTCDCLGRIVGLGRIGYGSRSYNCLSVFISIFSPFHTDDVRLLWFERLTHSSHTTAFLYLLYHLPLCLAWPLSPLIAIFVAVIRRCLLPQPLPSLIKLPPEVASFMDRCTAFIIVERYIIWLNFVHYSIVC